MIEAEDMLVYMPHPRTKGSTGFPDAVSDTDMRAALCCGPWSFRNSTVPAGGVLSSCVRQRYIRTWRNRS